VAEKRASCFKFSSLSNGFSKFPQLFACDWVLANGIWLKRDACYFKFGPCPSHESLRVPLRFYSLASTNKENPEKDSKLLLDRAQWCHRLEGAWSCNDCVERFVSSLQLICIDSDLDQKDSIGLYHCEL
jgi:hypothetical protein